MIIKKLCLHNFGVYAGNNEFVFHGKKPIVLIGGLNGRGKTTFLEAILLALYGKNSFVFDENGELSYGQYLRQHVNEADGTLETYLELHFSMSEDADYVIKREWNAKGKRTLEKIEVYKDSVFSQFLTDNWAMFMENVLPSALSSFFFFDGEKIAELAVEKTSRQMKESIKALLGITVLDHLESDLSRIVSRTARNRVDDEEAKIIDALRKERDLAEKRLADADAELDRLDKDIQNTQKKLDKANESYIAKGGDIVTQRQELIQKRSDARARLESSTDDLVAVAGSELPLVLVRRILENVRQKAEIEHDHKVMESALDKMYSMLDRYVEKTGANAKDAEDFLKFFSKQTGKGENTDKFDLSDSALAQIQSLLDQKLLERKHSTEDEIEKRDSWQKQADQLESYLSVDIDEKAISKAMKTIKQLELEMAELEARYDRLQEKRKNLNGSYITVSSEFNKKVEGYLKKVELNDDGDRIIKYATVATSVIDKYRIALQQEKTIEVAETMTNCYKQLANKKTLIDRIEMDPQTLDLKYLNKDGNEVPRKSLSAGEKQLMVIALLWSLAICSKKRLPVIIDTPLSRLDSVHRQALVKVYFPNASDQTIILSTDSEIDPKYYGMMRKNIDDEFTLVYDDKSKSTTINKGYFTEALK